MKRTAKALILASVCAAAAFTIFHFSPLEIRLAAGIRSLAPENPDLAILIRNAWMVSAAAAGLAGLAGLLGGAIFFPSASETPPTSARSSRSARIEAGALQVTLTRMVTDFAGKIRSRKITQDEGDASSQAADAAERLYASRAENAAFLEQLLAGIRIENPAKARPYQSSERPELLVEEARDLLKKTLYIDFAAYYTAIQNLPPDGELAWQLFADTMSAISTFILSVKKALDFYLDLSSLEKKRFEKLGEYNVMPLENPEPTDADLLLFSEQKKLGEDFPYSALLTFQDISRDAGVPFNPSLTGAYAFLDQCVEQMTAPLLSLIERGRLLLRIYQFTYKTEAYLRLRQIYDNLLAGKIQGSESATFYSEQLVDAGDHFSKTWAAQYREAMQSLRLTEKDLPAGVITPAIIEGMRSSLDTMKTPGSKVLYRTTSGHYKEGEKPEGEA